MLKQNKISACRLQDNEEKKSQLKLNSSNLYSAYRSEGEFAKIQMTLAFTTSEFSYSNPAI